MFVSVGAGPARLHALQKSLECCCCCCSPSKYNTIMQICSHMLNVDAYMLPVCVYTLQAYKYAARISIQTEYIYIHGVLHTVGIHVHTRRYYTAMNMHALALIYMHIHAAHRCMHTTTAVPAVLCLCLCKCGHPANAASAV